MLYIKCISSASTDINQQPHKQEGEQLMIQLDYQDRRPIYEQIVAGYKTLILSGALEAGEQMPSVRNLAMELSTNPNTVQKAYTELERQKYIYTVKGRGNYISEDNSLLKGEQLKELRGRLKSLLDETDELHIDRAELTKGLL